LASLLGIFIHLRFPANEPINVIGRVDVALSRQPRGLLAEHQQITVARDLVHEQRLQR
jgi:hypothetical protein